MIYFECESLRDAKKEQLRLGNNKPSMYIVKGRKYLLVSHAELDDYIEAWIKQMIEYIPACIFGAEKDDFCELFEYSGGDSAIRCKVIKELERALDCKVVYCCDSF